MTLIFQVQRAIESADAKDKRLRGILNQLYNYPNIPRKEAKFLNFLENSLRIRDKALGRQTWAAIASAAKATAPPKPANQANGTVPENQANGSVPENQANGTETDQQDSNSGNLESAEMKINNKKFKLKSVIKNILKSEENRKMKLKRLEKRAIGEYRKVNSKCDTEELSGTIRKKLEKLKNVKIDGKYAVYEA